MKLAITGHRPEDLPNPEWVITALEEALTVLKPDTLIQGMAAGVDLLSAELAIKQNIPVISARPWAGHQPRISDRTLYAFVMDNSEVINVNESQDYRGALVYHNRNKYMIDNADQLLAVWTGKDHGGTYSAVSYGKKRGLHIYQINPLTKISSWLVSESVPFTKPPLF